MVTDGEAEHPFKYTFFSFFREDPKTVFKELKRKDPREAFWGVFELVSFVTTFVILGILKLALHLFSSAVLGTLATACLI